MLSGSNPRLLHLVDPCGAQVGPNVVALMIDSLGALPPEQTNVLLIGGSTAERIVADLGQRVHDRIHPPAQRPWLAVTATRRFLRRVGPVDLIHAWSTDALSLAAIAAPSVPKALTLTLSPATAAEAHWLRILIEQTGAIVFATTNCVKRDWVSLGVPADQVHVLRPGLDLSRLATAQRDQIRDEWGIRSKSTWVVAALGQPVERIDAGRAARVLTLGRLMGVDLALVISPHSMNVPLGLRFARGGECEDRLILDERVNQPWSILPACDAALVLGDDTKDVAGAPADQPAGRMTSLVTRRLWSVLGPPDRRPPGDAKPMPGLLPMHWAAAAGKVIVADASYAASEMIENRQSGLLVTPGHDEFAMRRIDEAKNDQHLAWSLRDAARSEAYSVFSRQRYRSDLRAVYEQMINGEPVRVPDLPITGGMAFSGRV